MKAEIIKNLSEAGYCVSEAIDLIKGKTGYSQKDNYLRILDEALNDIKVVSSSIEIDEKLAKDPDILNKALKRD